MLLTLLLLAAGCSTFTPGAPGARPNPNTQRLPGVPSVNYIVDIDSLANRLLPATLTRLHWAVLQLDNQVTALRMTAINAADQAIEIRAQNIGNDRSAVQIRVGYFGDRKRERAFHQVLKNVIQRWRKKQQKR